MERQPLPLRVCPTYYVQPNRMFVNALRMGGQSRAGQGNLLTSGVPEPFSDGLKIKYSHKYLLYIMLQFILFMHLVLGGRKCTLVSARLVERLTIIFTVH